VILAGNSPVKISSYDYVEDQNGWIYIVKALLDDGSIIAKAFYNRTPNGSVIKCKETFINAENKPNIRKWIYGGPMDYIFSLKDISIIHRHDKYPILTYPNCDGLIYQIALLAKNYNFTAYLFGSRRLGIENDLSDWDMLFVGDGSPFVLVNNIVGKLSAKIRLFSISECEDRAKRYAERKQFDYKTLVQIFQKGTLYLRTNNNEIGLFFSHNNTDVSVGLEFVNEDRLNLMGKILYSGGSSVFLPRVFYIQDSRNIKSCVKTVLWEMGGIEANEGCKIELFGVYRLIDGSYWFGGEKAAMRFYSD
jgi:hypothetical protein